MNLFRKMRLIAAASAFMWLPCVGWSASLTVPTLVAPVYGIWVLHPLTLKVGAGESIVALEVILTGINPRWITVGEPTVKGLLSTHSMVSYSPSGGELRIVIVPINGSPSLANNLQIELPFSVSAYTNMTVTYRLIDAVPAVVVGPTPVNLAVQVTPTSATIACDSSGRGDFNSIDTDLDGICDDVEYKYGLNPNDAKDALLDFDGDGLSNRDEVIRTHTNPLARDSDHDGLSDGFADKLNLATNAAACTLKGKLPDQDFDCDGLTNLQEQIAGTKPDVDDSDGDGIKDNVEVTYGLNPRDTTDADKDLDGDAFGSNAMTSRQEILSSTPTKPLDPDTDSDLMPDGWEIAYGFGPADGVATHLLDPINRANQTGALDDRDGDGLANYQEFLLGTNPLQKDTDGDCMTDSEEIGYRLSPFSAADGEGDMDGDGLSNKLECLNHNAGINVPDSDNDGMKDGFEYKYGFPYKIPGTHAANNTGVACTGGLSTINNGTGPNDDYDCDGLTNRQENDLGSNPNDQDSDKDGMKDKAEVDIKRNPAVNEAALMSIIQNLLLN